MQILYLSKDNPVGHAGLAIVRRHFPQAAIQSHLFQSPRELLPNWVETQNNLLISFLCPRIIPKAALDCSAPPINFHPAPPEYPGFGCYNFALYDAVTTYGVSCHRITPQIDSGEIFAVRRFGVLSEDTISTLQQRSLQELCGLLDDVMAHVSEGKTLVATERWQRAPTSRMDFESLRQVPLDAGPEEVARRVHAFSHPEFDGAFIRLHGVDFVALPPGARSR